MRTPSCSESLLLKCDKVLYNLVINTYPPCSVCVCVCGWTVFFHVVLLTLQYTHTARLSLLFMLRLFAAVNVFIFNHDKG